MPDVSAIKVDTINVNIPIPRAKKGSQKTIAETYYDMYAIAESLAVEDIKVKAGQMSSEYLEDKLKGENTPRGLSTVELYKMRTERTDFHLNNMIAMFNKACEQPYKDTTEK
jgi:hypothetical protein